MSADSLRVLVRSGEHAVVINTDVKCGAFTQQGFLERTPFQPELWTEDGAWTERNDEHPLDIVGFYRPDGRLLLFDRLEQRKGSA